MSTAIKRPKPAALEWRKSTIPKTGNCRQWLSRCGRYRIRKYGVQFLACQLRHDGVGGCDWWDFVERYKWNRTLSAAKRLCEQHARGRK